MQYISPLFLDHPDVEGDDLRYDTTATEAAEMLADGLFGNTMAPTMKWHIFTIPDEMLERAKENDIIDDDDETEIRKWLEVAQSASYSEFQRSNYYDVMPIFLRMETTFNTATMTIEDDVENEKISCTPVHPYEMYLVQDKDRRIVKQFRKYQLKPKDCTQFDQEKLSDGLKKAIEDKSYEDYEFLHVLEFRKGHDPKKQTADQMPIASVHMEFEGKKIIKESGFKTWPSPTWRWSLSGTSPYGYGPADDAKPLILSANSNDYTLQIASQRAADPPKIIPLEMKHSHDFSPGGKTYTQPGWPRVEEVYSQARMDWAFELLKHKQESIRKVFKTQHFLMINEAEREMTAREITERKNEKVTVTGSTMGRFMSEHLLPVVKRVFQIAYDAGRIPPAPPALMKLGGTFIIDFLGPLAIAQKYMTNTQGILQCLDMSAYLFDVFPASKDNIDADTAVRRIWENNGMPPDVIRGEEFVVQLRQARAKQAQMQQQMEALEKMGKSMPGLSKKPERGSPAEMMENMTGAQL
jgi:BMFP domain-containing protein YqiC